MQKSDVISLFKTHPLVAAKLVLLSGDTLAHITAYNPDDAEMDPTRRLKFEGFCDSLNIRKPFVLVVDDDHISALTRSKTSDAAYMPLLDCLMIKASLYDAFPTANPKADYMVSHELGHAKLSRRSLLQSVLLSPLIAAGATYGSGKAIDALSSDNKAISVPGSALAGIAAFLASQKVMGRIEEFDADKYAAVAMGYQECMHGLIDTLLGERKEEFKENFLPRVELQSLLSGQKMTEEEVEQAFLLYMIDMCSRYYKPLKDIMRYPSDSDRIAKLAKHRKEGNASPSR